MTATQQDLFDFLAEIDKPKPTPPPPIDPTLCPHRHSVGKNGDGWTRDVDPESPHYGRWVDSNPGCRRPAYKEE